jgi:hypothetical protein
MLGPLIAFASTCILALHEVNKTGITERTVAHQQQTQRRGAIAILSQNII